MSDLLKFDLGSVALWKRQPGSVLLGLAFDGGRLEFAELRRTNGSVEIKTAGSVTLSLDVLTDDPQLVGHEIRKQLDAAGVRERWCVACIPLQWALTHTVQVPELSGEDLAAFLELETERGFPYSPETLMVAHSRWGPGGGGAQVTLVAVPRDHVARLEAALKAAQLRPVSFTLGLVALAAEREAAAEIALVPGENCVGLLVTAGGGVAVLRAVEGAFELEGGEPQIQVDHVLRELRITVGQLPAEVRSVLTELHVFGRSDAADALAEQIGPRAAGLGLRVSRVRDAAPAEWGLRVPGGTGVSPALSAALQRLAGRKTDFEFLPPKISPWRQFSERYASRKLAAVGIVAGAAAVVIALALLVQQWQLVRWRAKWTAMAPRVTELEAMQRQIKEFRPWFDESYRALSILRELTEAFPEDGAVAAKALEIRAPARVMCSGTARDHQALLQALDKLGAAPQVRDVQVEQMRGRSPIQFSFNFQWSDAGSQ